MKGGGEPVCRAAHAHGASQGGHHTARHRNPSDHAVKGGDSHIGPAIAVCHKHVTQRVDGERGGNVEKGVCAHSVGVAQTDGGARCTAHAIAARKGAHHGARRHHADRAVARVRHKRGAPRTHRHAKGQAEPRIGAHSVEVPRTVSAGGCVHAAETPRENVHRAAGKGHHAYHAIAPIRHKQDRAIYGHARGAVKQRIAAHAVCVADHRAARAAARKRAHRAAGRDRAQHLGCGPFRQVCHAARPHRRVDRVGKTRGSANAVGEAQGAVASEGAHRGGAVQRNTAQRVVVVVSH